MKLSDLYKQLSTVDDIDSFALFLAAPDSDGVDVDLASVGRVEVDNEQRVARLYPASTDTDADSVDPEPFLGMVLEQLPTEATAENDLRILAEIPLIREDGAKVKPTLADIVAVYIGKSSEEVWLLMRSAAEFAPGLLPD